MLLYSLLYLTGVGGDKGLSMADLRASASPARRRRASRIHHTLGVETTTGPLGQGIATAVGMALAERMLAAEFGDIVDHRTYVLASDGDLMEGVSQETSRIAGHLGLAKLIVLYDDNGITIDGTTSLADSVDQVARFRSRMACASVSTAMTRRRSCGATRAKRADKPTLIACKTTIGFGAPTRAGTRRPTAKRSARTRSPARARR